MRSSTFGEELAGMTVAAVQTLFAELRAGLVPLIAAIRTQTEADGGTVLAGDFPESAQREFSEKMMPRSATTTREAGRTKPRIRT